MVEWVKNPPALVGDLKNQIGQIWNYLFELSEAINRNLEMIGSGELSDDEKKALQEIFGKDNGKNISMREMIVGVAGYALNETKDANKKANDAMEILTGFVDGKGCEAATNLNGLTEQGTYYITEENAASAVNAPDTSKPIFVLVIRRLLTAEVDSVYQFAYCGANLYRRNNGHVSESGWTEWRQLY